MAVRSGKLAVNRHVDLALGARLGLRAADGEIWWRMEGMRLHE